MKPANPAKSIVLAAVAVVAVGGGLVYWQYTVHGDAEANLAKIRAATPDESKLQQDLQAAQAELYKASTELTHLEGGVPTLAYVPTLLQELEAVGNTNNMRVTVFKQSNPSAVQTPASTGDAKSLKEKAYDEVEFDVSGRGSYTSIEKMLTDLQIFPKIVSVQSVNVMPKRDQGAPNAATVEATIRLKAYIFKQADEQPKGDLQANNTPGGGQ